MLILTRKPGEQIRIGEDIVVQILELGRGVVKLGIEAPRNIIIHREEVFERVKEANLAAMEDVRSQRMDAALRLWRARAEEPGVRDENKHHL